MTVSAVKGSTVFSCDTCPEAYESEDETGFHEVWAEAKKKGWRARKVMGNWEHQCPGCVSDGAR